MSDDRRRQGEETSGPGEATGPPKPHGLLTVSRLISDGVLDAELAGLVWLLLGANLPLVVAGAPGSRPAEVAQALEALVAAEQAHNGHAARQLWLLEASSLEEVHSQLSGPPANLDADQLRGLGLVLVLHQIVGRGTRLAAAHYVRPIERDAGGHLQRRPPAVLAARDAQADRLEHYAWGVTSELAERLRLATADFEEAHQRRTSFLARLVEQRVLEPAAVRRAVSEFVEAERD